MSDLENAAKPPRPRVLVAGTAVAIETYSGALAGHAEVIAAHSVHEALERAEQPIDAVLCNVRFDESRMFEFLQAFGERHRGRNIPVICVRMYRPLAPATLAAVAEALEVLGVTQFLDLYDLREREGLEAALAELRRTVLEQCAKAE